MLVDHDSRELSLVQNRSERPGRTRIHPAEELNSILKTYCNDDQEFNPSMIRSIGIAVTKLSDNKMLYTADQELIYNFLKIQNDSLKRQNSPFDIVEIALKILAEPNMPLTLYNDEWIKNIVDFISTISNDIFQHNATQTHNLYSIIRHLSYVVQQINLPESSLYKLISISINACFHPASSPSLQSSSCSLIISIFKKHQSFRKDIIVEIIGEVEKQQMNIKYVIFPQNARKSISIISILLIEIIQSISSFPNETDNEIQEAIQLIIQAFTTRAKNNNAVGKIFERFVEDLSSLLSHPFYPASRIILKNTVEALFPSVSKKDENTRMSIKYICIALKSILKCSKRAKEKEVAIIFPKSVIESLSDLTEETIYEQLNDPETNISENDDDNFTLILSPSFPRNVFEEIIAHLIIALFLQQSTKFSNTINTSLPFNITLWSSKKLTKEEMDNYLLWWRGMLPSNIIFEWTLDIAEQINLHEICKLPMFSHVHLLVQHLLKGLENKNANIRSMILRGLSGIIEIDPKLLFHPSLVSQINGAFKDPSATIRDSVLQIISKYIIQNEQSSSPYFNVVINCLTDSSSMVVKRALGIVGQLTKNTNDESLARLCYLLSTKLNDESNTVAKAAKDILIQVLFEDAEDPTNILVNVIGKTQIRPLWFHEFFDFLYQKRKYAPKIEELIHNSFENANDNPNYFTCCLIREFCDVFPKICAEHHEIIVSIINSTTVDSILTVLPNALNSIIDEITKPNITLFSLLMQSIKKFIYSKSSSIIRSSIEVAAHISLEILETNDTLDQTFEYFSKFLKNSLSITKQKEFIETAESSKLANHICRAIYIIGCICRFHKSLVPKQVDQISGVINSYFKAPVPKIRSMVLQALCDICVRDPSLMQKAKDLVNHAFKLGPPENISAVLFLKNIIEEESKTDEITETDEVRPTYSSNLIHDFMFEILKCFSYKDSAIRTAVLDLSKVSLRYGAINPPDIIPHIISMLCSSDQSSLAMETLKIVIYHYSTFFINRMKDGINEAFNFVMSIHGPNFILLPSDDFAFHIGDLLNILQPPQKTLFFSAFIDILQDAFSTNPDPYLINWITRSLCNFPYSYVWEPSSIINKLNDNAFSAYINSAYADAKEISHAISSKSSKTPDGVDICIWYASTLILKTKQWIMKKYQIQQKKLKENDADKKTLVKVAIINPISFANIPIPSEENDSKKSILELISQFQLAMKMERSSDVAQYE